MLALFVVWVLLAIAVGVYASTRGRDPIVWAMLALFLSPLICVVILAVSAGVTRTGNEAGASVMTATELLQRLEDLFEHGALTDRDLARIRALAAREMPAPKPAGPKPIASDFTRPCPSCGKLVHPQATTCMHCWAKLPRLAA